MKMTLVIVCFGASASAYVKLYCMYKQKGALFWQKDDEIIVISQSGSSDDDWMVEAPFPSPFLFSINMQIKSIITGSSSCTLSYSEVQKNH